MKSMYTRSTLRYFTKTSIWPLLVYLQLTISYKKALFHFHYKNVELYVVTQRLNGLLLYWKHLHDGLASAIGIPTYSNKYYIFTYNKASKAFTKNPKYDISVLFK